MWRNRINPQPMFDVLAQANQREKMGNYVARMEIGDTPGFYNRAIHDQITKYSASPFRYSPSRGEPVLINKVIETQWPQASQENIVIGPANFLITAALASKTSIGDTVLLPDPGFPSYKLAADFLGLKIVYYPFDLSDQNSFPDLSNFILNMEVMPKVLLINNPSNPLGVGFSGDAVTNSLRNVINSDIEFIFDETYVNLTYDGSNPYSPNISAIRIRSFSKEHCAPGLRVGYAYGDIEAVNCMANFISLSMSCVPQFIQFAIADYLGSNDATEFTISLREEMTTRFRKLASFLPEGSLKTSPNAAFYALINVGPRGGEAAFAHLLEHNVSTCPGTRFGQQSRDSVRISLAGDKANFHKDLDLLASALESWNLSL